MDLVSENPAGFLLEFIHYTWFTIKMNKENNDTCINYWRVLCGRSLIVWRCFNKRSSHLRRLFLSWTSKTYNLTPRYPCVLHIPLLVMGIGSRCKVVAMKRIVEMLEHRPQDFATFLKWEKKNKRSPLGKIVMMFFRRGIKKALSSEQI